MRRTKRLIAGACVLFAMLLLFVLFLPRSRKASAAVYSDFAISSYQVEMTVRENRAVEVTERLAIEFAYGRHGFIRDLPLEGGIRYRDLTALRDGAAVPAELTGEDSSFLSLAVGDASVPLEAGRTYHYTVSYTMFVPALSEEGYLPLDVVGYGWQAEIGETEVLVAFPSGLKEYSVYSGNAGTTGNDRNVTAEREGNTLRLYTPALGDGGITLDLSFEEGVLSVSPDPALFWVLGVGLVFVALFALAKILLPQPVLVRTVNLTAPDEMDPLQMGKIIDNSVDAEDYGALVFWFASQGYLKIDLSEDENDPILIRTEKALPEEAPAWQRTFLEGLFRTGERVQISSLSRVFYTTAEHAKAMVSAGVGSLYSPKANFVRILLTVLGVCALGGFALVYSAIVVHFSYRFFAPLIGAAISAILSSSLSSIAAMRRFKWSKGTRILAVCGSFLLGLLPEAIAFLLPSASMSAAAVALCPAFASLFGVLSGLLVTRTKEYNERLGHILGFKDFILYTERDKIEIMLRERPELYYNILPYAQVLGVTGAWTDKFKDLTLSPPAYCYYNAGDALFDAVFYSHLFRTVNFTMGKTFVSRPSSSGGGGHFGGGSGGGFGGGGFGGGGGRSF